MIKCAVENGAYSAELYDLTPAEIHHVIISSAKRREEEMRSRAAMAWHTAYLTGLAVNAPNKFPRSPDKYFTFLSGKNDWRAHKARMAEFAERHNRKFGGESN